jgi:hypothetical protein
MFRYCLIFLGLAGIMGAIGYAGFWGSMTIPFLVLLGLALLCFIGGTRRRPSA